MFLENFSFAPYGLFVWSAFIFTFLTLFFLYKKVKVEFIEKEKLFLSMYKSEKVIKITSIEGKKYISGNQVY